MTERHEHVNYLNANYGIRSWLLTTDHKRISLRYLASIPFFFFIGGAMAVLFRLELLTPQSDLVTLARNSFLGSFLSDDDVARHTAALDAYVAEHV